MGVHNQVFGRPLSSVFTTVGAEFAARASELRSLAREVEEVERLVSRFRADHPAAARRPGASRTRLLGKGPYSIALSGAGGPPVPALPYER